MIEVEWISVKAGLPERFLPNFPEFSRKVLVVRGMRPEMARYRFDCQGWFHFEDSLLELCGVTHWMSLPDLPEVK